jgi:hypothetical protein
VEFKFSLPDPWKRQLFLALVRRHGLQPYYPSAGLGLIPTILAVLLLLGMI